MTVSPNNAVISIRRLTEGEISLYERSLTSSRRFEMTKNKICNRYKPDVETVEKYFLILFFRKTIDSVDKRNGISHFYAFKTVQYEKIRVHRKNHLEIRL